MRVVSLVPSVTETLLAWGVEPVACTRFCEQPGLAAVGGTKNPDVQAIVALAPDLVVMDEEENRREDHQALVAAGLAVHVTAVRSLEDVERQLPRLARRVGARWPATTATGRSETAASRSGPTSADRLGPTGRSPASPAADGAPLPVVVPIWRRPWMVLGTPTYGASLLAHLGATVVGPPGRGPYPEVTADELRALGGGGVVTVLAPSEPYPFGERHRPELADVGPVRFVDGRDLFWWGVRTAGALARLAEVLADAVPGAGR